MQRATLLHRMRPGDVVVVGDRDDVQPELIRMGCSGIGRDR